MHMSLRRLLNIVIIHVPAIPVKAPTRKSAPGRVHGKNPQKCAHGPVFCTSEVTHAGSVPNNPPMGQLLGETMVSITCVINTLSGTWRSNEGATYYFTKYCCVKWKCGIYDNILSIICLMICYTYMLKAGSRPHA